MFSEIIEDTIQCGSRHYYVSVGIFSASFYSPYRPIIELSQSQFQYQA